ncbi:MAG: hypothetical protein WBA10_02435 [Elainellaceae cyanobacterium]
MDYKTLTEHLQGTFPDELAARINVEQMFTLVDSVLSIETCLHHQILPLFLEGSRLHLGMVFTNDTAAHDYIRRIVTYLNYSLVSQAISASALQTALSAYLKYSAVIRAEDLDAKNYSNPSNHARTVLRDIQNSPSAAVSLSPTTKHNSDPLSNQTGWRRQGERRQGERRRPLQPEAETYVIDSPTVISETNRVFPVRETAASDEDTHEDIHGTLRLDDTVQLASAQAVMPLQSPPKPVPQPPAGQGSSTPTLSLDLRYPELPFEQLKDLSPRYLLPELVGRALSGKISRLYFESQLEQGRILLSDSGVLRSAIDSMPKEQLQGVLNELKQMMQLPLVSASSANYSELEYTYGQSTVILRVRITTNQCGESAMLQVLQGSALKMYQRQQMIRMGQEAIDAAKQLQLRISELASRMMASPHQSDPVDTLLNDLSQILQGVGEQVTSLKQLD